jgi:glycine C-acetyltransferase
VLLDQHAEQESADKSAGFTDVFAKCDTDGGYFGKMRAMGDDNFTRPTLHPNPSRQMEFKGRQNIMWSINNYLGLANHPEVIQAGHRALDEFGVSSPMGSRMMSGNTEWHQAFERELAEFTEKEAAFLFNYGYMGVQGTIQSLLGKDDIIVMDKLAHACIVDGAFLAQAMNGAQLRVFKHNNMENLEQVLKRVNRDRKGGVLILTEGVYGMTGDLARLPEITALKEQYDARLYIDDAHGWGTMGAGGRGTADHFGVQDKVDIYFGTFAKSFASIGGFSASTRSVIEWITYNARTQVFAKSLPMIYVQTLRKTFELVQSGEDRRTRMWAVSTGLKNGLRDLGFYVGPGESPICSVFVPLGENSMEHVGAQTAGFLRNQGVFATAITYPVIPLGLLMFRIIPTATHTDEDVEETLRVFRDMRDNLGLRLTMTEEEDKKIRKMYGI